MPRSRAKSSNKEIRKPAQPKRSQGSDQPPQPLRRSARLQPQNETKHLLPSPPTTHPPNLNPSPPLEPDAISPCYQPDESETHRKPEGKGKRSQQVEVQGPSEKRPRTDTDDHKSSCRVETWLQKGHYPEDHFESSDKTWEDIKADTSNRFEVVDMAHLPFARKKSSISLLRQALEANTGTPTQKTEDKSAVYKDSSYPQFLMEHGSFLEEYHQGIEENSKNECQTLLNTEQIVPKDSDTLFRDDRFQSTCKKLRDRNKARVVNDIARLIVPSAETLATFGATHLGDLVVGINERWNESIPLLPTATLPQPDFSVGFKRSAFTKEQLKKLEPFTGNIFASTKLSSFVLATWRMYFPFFTCEVKSGLAGLDIADRQNANSMTLSVKGLVELFRFVDREKEVHRKILSFSISHDDKCVRIFGHYPVIDGDETTFYRHPIDSFNFTNKEGEEKWTAYKFVRNVYDTFMPKHHKLICSVIDDIPSNLNFDVSSASFRSAVSPHTEAELDSQGSDSQEMAVGTPGSQNNVGPKRKRLTGNAVLQQRNEELTRQLTERDENPLGDLVRMLQADVERQRQENERLRQSDKSGNDSEIVTMLKEQLERQRQESERQRQESERQRQESERQWQEMKRETELQRKEGEEKIEKLLQQLLEKSAN